MTAQERRTYLIAILVSILFHGTLLLIFVPEQLLKKPVELDTFSVGMVEIPFGDEAGGPQALIAAEKPGSLPAGPAAAQSKINLPAPGKSGQTAKPAPEKASRVAEKNPPAAAKTPPVAAKAPDKQTPSLAVNAEPAKTAQPDKAPEPTIKKIPVARSNEPAPEPAIKKVPVAANSGTTPEPSVKKVPPVNPEHEPEPDNDKKIASNRPHDTNPPKGADEPSKPAKSAKSADNAPDVKAVASANSSRDAKGGTGSGYGTGNGNGTGNGSGTGTGNGAGTGNGTGKGTEGPGGNGTGPFVASKLGNGTRLLSGGGGRPPVYPKNALNAGKEGQVVERIYIRADGSLEKIETLKLSGDPSLEKSARYALEHQWKTLFKSYDKNYLIDIRFIYENTEVKCILENAETRP